jgi:hypothetical protein
MRVPSEPCFQPSSLKVRDQASQPYKTTGKQYVSMQVDLTDYLLNGLFVHKGMTFVLTAGVSGYNDMKLRW